MNYKVLIIIPFLYLFSFCTPPNGNQNGKTNFKTISLKLDIQQNQAQVKHGLAQLIALSESDIVRIVDSRADYTISSKIDSVNLKPEACKIEVSGKDVHICGGDAVGIMYALLEIKVQLQNYEQKINYYSQ